MTIWSGYSPGTKGKSSPAKDESKSNMCKTGGPMSFCEGKSKEEREASCTYYDEGRKQDCMHWHENRHGSCDCVWAQRGIAKPK